ncbi:hypothetical protein E4T56_gene19455 [Termitomyces sp. T112]|nr:hypothetical protein E4T56_gene19455 [Termitomyces sp. T112]KAH0586654.1 hypothetical protein H2248_007870 [Termitomyces sp. 'cryptogamus']
MLGDSPFDILIVICSYLELSDVFSLATVCSTLRKFANSKYLWIDALKRTGRIRSLACLPSTNLTQMSVDELKCIAHRTRKLEYNWNQRRPRIVRSLGPIQYSNANPQLLPDILAVIPGTSFVVLHLRRLEKMLVCDSEGKKPTRSIDISTLIHHTHWFHEPECHLIALISDGPQSGTWLRILSIDLESLEIREIFATRTHPRVSAPFFLDSSTIGLVDIINCTVAVINFIRDSSAEIVLKRDLAVKT